MLAPSDRFCRRAALLAAALVLVALTTARGAVAQGPRIYMPLSSRHFAGPFVTAAPPPVSTGVPTMLSDTPVPVTPTSPAATPTDGPDEPTATASGTDGPEPSATPSGPPVGYSHDPKTIVLQIGVTDTDEVGAVWEEMNGTPWLTVYGDGRVIAGRILDPRSNLDQELFVGQVPDAVLQSWLQTLVHEVGFFQLKDDYQHARGSKPEVHFWLRTEAQSAGKRVSLRGYFTFEKRGADMFGPDGPKLMALVRFARAVEASVQQGGAAAVGEPFVPECFTILAQKTQGFLADPPAWDSSAVNPGAIAAAAPTAASNYVDKVVGHYFANTEIGLQVQALVVPVAMQWFPLYKRAGEFRVSGRPHGVGVRREVPGGSWFLPQMPNAGGWAGGVDIRRSYWYRHDAGPRCTGLRSAASVDPPDPAIERLLATLRAESGRLAAPWSRLSRLLPAPPGDGR